MSQVQFSESSANRFSFDDFARFEWHERSIVCRFSRRVLVLSTSRRNGGLREDLSAAVNYQICEPGGCPTCEVCIDKLDEHIDMHAEKLNCDPERTATMITAARMRNAGSATRSHGGVDVLSVMTAGVETNAARAGDRATHYESPSGWRSIDEAPPVGIINLILLVNRRLTDGALVKAGIMATEAKSATLDALRVRSRYGYGIATGTGTDQFMLACPQDSSFAFTEAQAHVILGQLIADTVSEALRVALTRQGGLTLESRRSVRALLMRFGGDADAGERDGDPAAVAAAAALAAVFDHLEWGIITATERSRVVARHAATLARAIGGDGSAAEVEKCISESLTDSPDMPYQEVINLALRIGRA